MALVLLAWGRGEAGTSRPAALVPDPSRAALHDGIPPEARVSGKYHTLLRRLWTPDDLGSYGRIKWGYVRDLGATVEVYADNTSTVFPTMTVVRTATGVYEVTVPGIQADGGWHGIWVSPQQGQTTIFRACKTFQTVGSGTEPQVTVRVRCYDENAALANTDFSILILQ